MEALKCHTTCDFLGIKTCPKTGRYSIKKFLHHLFSLKCYLGLSGRYCIWLMYTGLHIGIYEKDRAANKRHEKRREHKNQARAEKGKQQKVEN